MVNNINDLFFILLSPITGYASKVWGRSAVELNLIFGQRLFFITSFQLPQDNKYNRPQWPVSLLAPHRSSLGDYVFYNEGKATKFDLWLVASKKLN